MLGCSIALIHFYLNFCLNEARERRERAGACPPTASLSLFTFRQITFVSPSENVFSIDLFHLDRSGKCGVFEMFASLLSNP